MERTLYLIALHRAASEGVNRALRSPAADPSALAALRSVVRDCVGGRRRFPRRGSLTTRPSLQRGGHAGCAPFAPCVALEPPEALRLPVTQAPDESIPCSIKRLPPGRLVLQRARWTRARAVVAGGRRQTQRAPVIGWVLLPDDLDEVALYGGSCDPARLPVWEG